MSAITLRLQTQARRHLAALGHEGRATLLLLVAVAAVIAPHFAHLPGWALAVAVGAFGWKCRLLAAHRASPSRVLLALVVAAIAVGTWQSYGSLFGRDAGVTLLVMLMCLKLLELHVRRDSFVVAYLGFFLAATEFMFSQSIPTAAMVLVALALLLAAMVAGQLGAADPQPGATATAADGAPPATGLRLALLTGLRLVGWALPLAIALFLLFPRIPGPLWTLPGDSGGAHTGLTDSMSPGDLSDLADSGAIAFRARFPGVAPAQSELYWRAIVMGGFDGRTWRPALPAQFGAVAGPGTEAVVAASDPIDYQLTVEPTGERWLYALDGPLALGPGAESAAAGTWQAAQSLRERTALAGRSATSYRLGGGETPLARRAWTALPPGYNPRSVEFAARLRADYPDDRQLISAVLGRFRHDGYRYTMRPPRLGRDSVDGFLFDTRAGFCEHYASAFAVLMRAAGIPARVVAGYQGGEVNPVDGWLEVRQSDAHAWTEVWLGRDAGWVRIDPTAAVAPERIERSLGAALPATSGFERLGRLGGGSDGLRLWRDVRHRWNAIENAWNLAVLHYDGEQQRNLFERLGLGAPDLQVLMIGCLVALGLASAGFGANVLMQAARRPRPDRLARLGARFDASLARIGCVREPHEPPAAFARRVVALLEAGAASTAPASADPVGHAPADAAPRANASTSNAAAQARRIFETLAGMRYRRPPTPAELEALQRWIADFKPRSPR